MVDVFSSKKRSEVMRRVRSHGNKTTEVRLIEIFRAQHMTGWRRKQSLFGKPDFVFRKEKVCIFVDGCFWHGCPKCSRTPTSNVEYWVAKIDRNRTRDRLVSTSLRRAGWRVLRIWEHELKDGNRRNLLRRLKRALFVSARLNLS